MDLSKIDALTMAAKARLQLHRNEAESTRVIASRLKSDEVFIQEVPGALLQHLPPSETVPLTVSVMAGVESTSPKSPHHGQLVMIPSENPGGLLVEVRENRDQLIRVQGNRYEKEADLQAALASSYKTNRRRNPSFAYKLHAILTDKDCNSAISWMPSGKAFRIMDKEEFTKKVLPKYFREAKFESFSRRIKRWGFRRMYTTGMKQVVYSHDLFQKDRVDLCKLMNGRAGQAMIDADHDTAFNPARFENEMEEQVALVERTLQANHKSVPEKEVQGKQMQTTARRPVPASSSLQVPIYFGTKPSPMATAYHYMCLEHPMVMANIASEAFVSSPWRYPMLEYRASYMPYNGTCDLNVVRQLSALDKDIAVCEEKLAILHRLKTLKNKSRALHH